MSTSLPLCALALCAGLMTASCGDDGDASVVDTTTATDTTSDATTEVDTTDTSAGDTVAADVSDVAEAQLPIGLVYAPSEGVGIASYHFDAPDDVYIDYRNADAMGWRLGSGASVPAKKPFTDFAIDYENKRFTGTIDWSSDPFLDRVSFEYDMHFSDDYSEISGGSIVVTYEDDSTLTLSFETDLAYRVVTDADPYPFASLVSCVTRPLPLDDVVFVGVFEDAQCTRPTGTTIALPLDGSAGCCNGYNDTQTSFSDFACADGDYAFTMAYSLCGSAPPISATANVSADSCQQFQLLGSLYLQVMPGGACTP